MADNLRNRTIPRYDGSLQSLVREVEELYDLEWFEDAFNAVRPLRVEYPDVTLLECLEARVILRLAEQYAHTYDFKQMCKDVKQQVKFPVSPLPLSSQH